MIADAEPIYREAVALLIGADVPRDLPRARRLFRQAAGTGHVDAAHFEIALAANGSGGPVDWSTALAMLRDLRQRSEAARAQLALLERMELDADGMPLAIPKGEIIGRDPHVMIYRRLLTPAECAHVATSVQDIMEPSSVVDPRTGRSIANPIRTSAGAVIGPTREDLVIGAINRRLAAITGMKLEQGEPLSILHYAPGQEYRPHLDALPHTTNQRIATVIIYLNDGYQGGETAFPRTGLRVRGQLGDALVFRNVTADGRIDERSVHAGLPVTVGRKWVATRWIRERAFDPWDSSQFR